MHQLGHNLTPSTSQEHPSSGGETTPTCDGTRVAKERLSSGACCALGTLCTASANPRETITLSRYYKLVSGCSVALGILAVWLIEWHHSNELTLMRPRPNALRILFARSLPFEESSVVSKSLLHRASRRGLGWGSWSCSCDSWSRGRSLFRRRRPNANFLHV